MEIKKCSKCGELKPLSDFDRDKSKKSGYKSQCKLCIKNNPEKQKYLKEYRDSHKDYFKEKHAEYRERNREKLKEKSREYYRANPEKVKKYYIVNRDRILKYSHDYKQSERGKATIKARQQTEKYKGYKTYDRMRRRNKCLNGDKDITLEKLYERSGGICALCGELCDYENYEIENGFIIVGDTYPSIDHIKPISKGGSHTWDNVQLAHKLCNCAKADKEAT